MLAVVKKGKFLPVEIFDGWWNCAKWCDENITKEKGCDPAQYEIIDMKGFKKIVFVIYVIHVKLKELSLQLFC